jgi:hypothetical protein
VRLVANDDRRSQRMLDTVCPQHGVLQQATLGDELQKLFWAGGLRQRPQTRA